MELWAGFLLLCDLSMPWFPLCKFTHLGQPVLSKPKPGIFHLQLSWLKPEICISWCSACLKSMIILHLQSFLNVILTWSLNDPGRPFLQWALCCTSSVWFRCCSAAGTWFCNYKFIKSESHQQSLELLFRKYIGLISFSQFLICSLPNIYIFLFHIFSLLAFHSAWPKK